MHRLRLSWLIPGLAVLLIAADPVWMNKPIPNWTEEDARQVLANSPWAKTVVAGVAPLGGEDQRRESGNMGQPRGVGYDGLGEGTRRILPGTVLGAGVTSQRAGSQVIRLLVRWESALPIRAAELKAREADSPMLSEAGYSIAVYGIPGTYLGDPEKLGNPLKGLAALKREGTRNVKPTKVEVFQLERGAAVVYLFPLSAEIDKTDGAVEFTALIGRLQVSGTFNVEKMRYQGKLEL